MTTTNTCMFKQEKNCSEYHLICLLDICSTSFNYPSQHKETVQWSMNHFINQYPRITDRKNWKTSSFARRESQDVNTNESHRSTAVWTAESVENLPVVVAFHIFVWSLVTKRDEFHSSGILNLNRINYWWNENRSMIRCLLVDSEREKEREFHCSNANSDATVFPFFQWPLLLI